MLPTVIRVWDRLVRCLHWLLVPTVVSVWITGHWFDARHHALGYAAVAIVAVRVLWGFWGSPHARFSDFVQGPRRTWQYFRLLLKGREPRHLGHNPLGGWMVVALLSCIALCSITGFLYTTDWLWGYAWLDALHAGLAWTLALLVAAHLCGVLMMSLRGRENLVLGMFTGNKRADRR